METEIELEKRQSKGLAGTHAKKLTLLTVINTRKNEPDKKAQTDITKLWLKTLKPILETLALPKRTQARKNELCKMESLACQNLTEKPRSQF